MEQKVIKIGNSLGLILPKQVIKSLNITLGQKLYIDVYEQENTLTLRTRKNLAKGITPEFIKFLEEFADRHKGVLSELARR